MQQSPLVSVVLVRMFMYTTVTVSLCCFMEEARVYDSHLLVSVVL